MYGLHTECGRSDPSICTVLNTLCEEVKKGEKGKKGNIIKRAGVRRRTLSSALGVESPDLAVFHGFGSSLLSDALHRRYAPPVRTLSITKGPSHLGLSLSFFSGRRRTSSPIL